jgi:nitrogen fixation NifU-like protein
MTEQEELEEVFSETVNARINNPQNASIADADAYASVMGSCGDNMEMWLKVHDNRIADISFWTDGCGATIACGSMAAELAKGKTLGEAMSINASIIIEQLGGLPNNHIHCAGLASLTLKKALVEYINLEKEPWKKAYRKY